MKFGSLNETGLIVDDFVGSKGGFGPGQSEHPEQFTPGINKSELLNMNKKSISSEMNNNKIS
jgi:hypothetical protein